MSADIGRIIAELRKARGATQEELGSRDVLQALVLLYGRERAAFTGELFVKRPGDPAERAEQIIVLFESWGLIVREELELNDERLKIYKLKCNPALVPFLVFAGKAVNRLQKFLERKKQAVFIV